MPIEALLLVVSVWTGRLLLGGLGRTGLLEHGSLSVEAIARLELVLIFLDLDLLGDHWHLAGECLHFVLLVAYQRPVNDLVVQSARRGDLGLHAALVARFPIVPGHVRGSELIVDLRDLLPEI